MYSSRQEPFLVTETNAQAISFTWINEPAYDGQWRQAAWALISRGASMIEYWHWHTLHYGAETYWGGILPHSGEPGRTYRELAALGAELERAGATVAGLTPDADVTLLYSGDTKWALEKTPALGDAAGQPDHRSYQKIFEAFSRGAFDAGLQARVIHPSQLFDLDPADGAARHPVLVAAGFLIATDEHLQWLEQCAAAGGHLVARIRTGYEDELARARTERKPAFLTEAAGLWYDEFSTLRTPVPVHAEPGSPLTLPAGAEATGWIDGITTEGAEVLAGYGHPHFGRWPAVTTHRHGAGRVTYVGTVPNPALAAALFDWARPATGRTWRPQADCQTVTGATARDGSRLRFVHNWSFDQSTYKLPAAVQDISSDEPLGEGTLLTLGPWDVRILRLGDKLTVCSSGRKATRQRTTTRSSTSSDSASDLARSGLPWSIPSICSSCSAPGRHVR